MEIPVLPPFICVLKRGRCCQIQSGVPVKDSDKISRLPPMMTHKNSSKRMKGVDFTGIHTFHVPFLNTIEDLRNTYKQFVC